MISALDTLLIRKSIADVTRRKGRTLLVVLAIFIGVFGLTGINVFEFKIFDGFAFMQNRSSYPDITFIVDHLDPDVMKQFASTPGVKTIQAQMVGKFQWPTTTIGTVGMYITAFPDPQHSKLGKFELTSGHQPGPGEILLESNDTVLQPFSLNELIHLNGPTGPVQLRVAGTSRTPGLAQIKATKTAQGYMSIESLSQLLKISTPNSIAVKVKDIQAIQGTASALKQILHKHALTIEDTTIQSSIAEQFGSDFVTGFFNLVRTLAAGALIVSCFLLINTLTTLIAEQMKIIGTMKAVGGTQGTIIRGYLFTVLIYSLLGTFFGLLLGIIIGYIGALRFATIKGWDLGPFSIAPSVFLIGLLSGIALPLLAAMVPLINGTHITVREAISAYGVINDQANNRRWQRFLAEHLHWLPQTAWLGLRGIFRKRGRALMTITALALSGTTFLAAMTVKSSINEMALHLNDQFIYDVSVSSDQQAFSQPFAQLRQALSSIPNVAHIEAGTSAAINTPWGITYLQGIDSNTRVYRKSILAGHWLLPGERNVLLLDKDTLQRANLAPGARLSFSTDTGHRASWKIIGVLNDISPIVGFHGLVVTSTENVNRLVGNQEGSVNQLFIQTRDHSPASIKQTENKVQQVLQNMRLKFTVASKQEQAADDANSAMALYIIFYVAAAGVGLVGILGLYNTLTSSVLERQREIGICRSMGASSGQVARIFWLEGLALTLIAWLLSLLLGLPISYGFVTLFSQWLFPIPFAFDLWSLPLMLLVLISIGSLACFGPTVRASRVRIAETLRYE